MAREQPVMVAEMVSPPERVFFGVPVGTVGIVLGGIAMVLLFAGFLDPRAGGLSAAVIGALLILLLVPLRVRHGAAVTLVLLTIAGQGIGGLSFLLSADTWEHSGWRAVGDFSFASADYLRIQFHVWIMLTIALGTAILIPHRGSIAAGPRLTHALQRRASREGTAGYGIALFALIALAIPLNLAMYNWRIAMVGITPPELPYRLSGILFYLRGYLLPAAILVLFSRSRRGVALTWLVLGYALLAGITAASRGTFLLSSLPVLVWNAARLGRLAALAFYVTVGMVIISFAKVALYANPHLSIVELGSSLSSGARLSGSDLLDMVIVIVQRLGGPQDVVLAWQFPYNTPIFAIFSYFASVPPPVDIARDVFGLHLPPEMSFGVAMSHSGWAFLLWNGSYPRLILFGILTGLVLALLERSTRNVQAHRIADPRIVQIFAVLAVFFLHIGVLRYTYGLIALALVLPMAVRTLRSLYSGDLRGEVDMKGVFT
jgi:hypothetical protein